MILLMTWYIFLKISKSTKSSVVMKVLSFIRNNSGCLANAIPAALKISFRTI